MERRLARQNRVVETKGSSSTQGRRPRAADVSVSVSVCVFVFSNVQVINRSVRKRMA